MNEVLIWDWWEISLPFIASQGRGEHNFSWHCKVWSHDQASITIKVCILHVVKGRVSLTRILPQLSSFDQGVSGTVYNAGASKMLELPSSSTHYLATMIDCMLQICLFYRRAHILCCNRPDFCSCMLYTYFWSFAVEGIRPYYHLGYAAYFPFAFVWLPFLVRLVMWALYCPTVMSLFIWLMPKGRCHLLCIQVSFYLIPTEVFKL
jgi:hypothetical protein